MNNKNIPMLSLVAACTLMTACKGSVVEFTDANYETTESDKFVDITVQRTGDAKSALSVNYSSEDISANAELDYESLDGTLSWEANDLGAKTIRLNLLADIDEEDIEELQITLSDPTSGSVGTKKATIVSISDSACDNELRGSISESLSLNEYCYHVTTSLSVNTGAELTIEPGVTVLFDESTILNIQQDGALIAAGLEDDGIVLTGVNKTPGSWAGLQFTWSDNTANMLDYTTIEYGGSTGGNGTANLVLFGTNGLDQRIRMSNTTLRHSANYGFEFSHGANIDLFSKIVSTENAMGPALIPSDLVGTLNPDSDFSGNGDDRITVYSSNIDTPQMWSTLNVPYHITNGLSVTVPLTLNSGSTLIFAEDTHLNIQTEGSLNAVGTEEKPILFTAEEEIPGFWKGIQFTFSDQEENEIAHAIVEYGGGRINGEANLVLFGTIGLEQQLKLSNTILRNGSGYGFEFSPGATLSVFEGVTSTGNELGAGILPGNILHMLDDNSDYSGNDIDRIFVKAGGINVSQTWPALNVPYEIISGHTISAQLFIDAGATFYQRENSYYNIQAGGSLTAIGTPESPIIFTGLEEVPGYWQGIQFTFSPSNDNILDNTIIEYAGGPGGNGAGAVVLFGNVASNASNLTLIDSLIQHSGEFGVWLHDASNLSATGNSYNNNQLGDIFVE